MAIDRRERMAGALLGVHAGDALGATVEFDSWEYIKFKYPQGVREVVGGGVFDWPAGHATDDTDLTRAVLLAYLDPGADVVLTAANRMLDWYQGNWPGREPGSTPRDVGGATRDGLLKFAHTGDPRRSGAGLGRAGNGSLMRCLPTALAVADRATRLDHARRISAITHDDPRCTIACAAYVEIVVALLAGATPQAALEVGSATAMELRAQDVSDAILFGAQLSLEVSVRGGHTYLPDDGNGFVLDSLSLATAALMDERSLEELLIDVVRLGNDTDTNAAIAGGLVGARDGLQAIPAQWLGRLQFRDEFLRAVDRLAGAQ